MQCTIIEGSDGVIFIITLFENEKQVIIITLWFK